MSYKLYFKYGVIGCSKSAQALMTKFNYEQKGFNVWFIKPSTDTRDDKDGKPLFEVALGLRLKFLLLLKTTICLRLLQNKTKKKKLML